MEQCELCGRREGVREAAVYLDGEKKTVPVCAPCVYEAMRKNRYGLGFGLGLQLCWFVVAGQGLLSVAGAFAAVMAVCCCWRRIWRSGRAGRSPCPTGSGNTPWPRL